MTTVGLTQPTNEDSLLPLVDHSITVAAEHTAAGAPAVIDVVDWAAAIVDTVHELHRNRRQKWFEVPLHER